MSRRAGFLALCAALGVAITVPARAAGDATPGYPERVLQWTVKEGETCDDIAAALYGSPKYRGLIERYNAVQCAAHKGLPNGMTLVVPAKVTELPAARLRSLHPDVRQRPPGGAWQPATAGMALVKHQSVNTLEKAHADILFVDRTRIVLGQRTLVVIYGTANQSAVSRTPPTVELDSGEVEAGLAALRGNPLGVDTEGGKVTVRSRDTAVRAKRSRATVSVFDGSADVTSAKKQVHVRRNFGTSFRKAKPPTPPRPLPPAPHWLASTVSGVVLAPPGKAVIRAGWEAVPNAKTYRVELARDAQFVHLVARDEVPARIRQFRAEKLPPGSYYLRVRAIDKDDFLGIASTVRAFAISDASNATGRIDGHVIEASPYGVLGLAGFAGLEVAVDGGPFVPVPHALDLLRLAPHTLSFRVQGGKVETRYRLEYVAPHVDLAAIPEGAGALDVSVAIAAGSGVDVASRVQPALRVEQAGAFRSVPLVPGEGTWTALVDGLAPGRVKLAVTDERSRVLATKEVVIAAPPKRTRKVAQRRSPDLGISAPLVQPSPTTDVVWWAPTPRSGGSLSTTGYVQAGQPGALVSARAAGSFGRFGFDGLVSTRELHGPPADGSAWFSLGYRELESRGFELGTTFQLGLPVSSISPASRVGYGLAAGNRFGRWSWLLDVGGRARLEQSGSRRASPAAQGFVLFGSTYDALAWLRGYALLDMHGAIDSPQNVMIGRGGLTLGAEAGTRVFGSLSVRVSPWDDAGGAVMGQLAAGVRQ